MVSKKFDGLNAAAEAARAEDAGAGARSLAAQALFLDEIWGSTALAGSLLSRSETAALVQRGLAVGDRRLQDYVLVADYAAAARAVAVAPPAGARRPYLALAEIVDLHALAVRRSGDDRPGRWRTTATAPFASGMVAPAPWLVPRAVESFVERLARGPAGAASPLYWVAEAHENFERIHPFATANGRVGRLVVNLLLGRLGYPPLVVAPRDEARYLAALRRADARDPWPLATVVARGVLASFDRLAGETAGGVPLQPLSAFGDAGERAALYKAAQRGRLRTVRRGGQLLTTPAWIATYYATRAPSGRRREGDMSTRSKAQGGGDDSANTRPL